MNEQPGDQVIAMQFEERISVVKLNLDQARIALNKELQVMSMLEDELLKVIEGTSSLKPELLNKKHDQAELSVADKKLIVETLEQELANSKETMQQITRQYNSVLTWADMYAEASIDVKKMIVAQLISEVRVSRDYEIDIDFKISEQQLGLDHEEELEQVRGSEKEAVPIKEAEKTPKQKKGRGGPEL